MKRLALILLFVLLGTAAPLPADDAAAPATGEAAKVDAEAARLLKEARYAWRSPRPEHSPEQGESLPWEVLRSLGDALKPAWDWFEGHVRSVMDWLGRLLDHLLRGMPWDKLGRARQGVKAPELGDAPLWVAWFLLGGAAVAVALILLRRARAPKPRAAQVGVLPPPVDLARASLSGAELPEDGWLKLARELEAKGEHRLALRAYFLAGLNALGKAGLLSLAPSRSVGDYRRQLARRAAGQSALAEAFDGFGRLYERAWFSDHGADAVDCAKAADWQGRLHGRRA